jgi:hypothetical protein
MILMQFTTCPYAVREEKFVDGRASVAILWETCLSESIGVADMHLFFVI